MAVRRVWAVGRRSVRRDLQRTRHSLELDRIEQRNWYHCRIHHSGATDGCVGCLSRVAARQTCSMSTQRPNHPAPGKAGIARRLAIERHCPGLPIRVVRRPESAMRFLPFILVLGLLTGCVWPHTTPRSPAVTGRVLDARTHVPIRGAKVFLTQPPAHATYTDKNGCFHMKATRNFILMQTGAGELPREKIALMLISQTNYISHELAPDWHHENIGDLFLEPKP